MLKLLLKAMTITTPGAVIVQATGLATAEARVATPTIEISGIKIAVNDIAATLNAAESVYQRCHH